MPVLIGAAVLVLVLAAAVRRSAAWLCMGLAWSLFGAVVLVTPWSPADRGQPADGMARAEDVPAVLAGDLDLTDRGAAFRRLAAGRVDALRTSWAAPTSFRLPDRPLLLRIDHVLIPPGWWCADAGTQVQLTGSDHDAVAATIGPCRRPGQAEGR